MAAKKNKVDISHTGHQWLAISTALARFEEAPLKGPGLLRLSINAKKIHEIRAQIIDARSKLVERIFGDDVKDEQYFDKDKQFSVEKHPKFSEFRDAIQEMLDEEIEIEITKINPEAVGLNDVEVPLSVLGPISFLFEDED